MAIACGLWTLLATVEVSAQPAAPFKVIVNASVAGAKIPRKLLGDVFLRKVTRWGDGSAIEPVDQSSASAIRESFSRQVLGQPVAALVQSYWAKEITSGRSRPPVVKGSDEEVIKFVAATKGGIGYVAADAAVPEAVKLLLVE